MTSDTRTLRTIAVRSYIQHGGGESGARAAWAAVRARLPHLRAPRWNEQLYRNGAKARFYVSPLGSALVIPGARNVYGHHCASYPRTRRSYADAAAVRTAILDWLESEACRLP